jgi:hypothetical protein
MPSGNKRFDYQQQFVFRLCAMLHQLQKNNQNGLSIELAFTSLLD